jgi:NADH-quinone oxidoreductase subunit H
LIFPGVAFITTVVMVIVWFERKFLARVMLRIGPLHVGRYAGWLQIIADFLKLLAKERVVPDKADKAFYVAMPILAVFIAGLGFAVIPFSERWVIFDFPLSLLFVFATLALFPIIILMTGWSSNNKYSFIGGLREAFQYLAYEIPIMLSLLGVVMLSQSFNLIEIAQAQSGMWFVLLQPLGFLIFFIAALAELGRAPFDIPEAEQEIVIGPFVEYTGINFGLFQMAMYLRFYLMALLMTVLFFGGWSGPFLHPVAWTLIKSGLIVVFIILVRAAFPRVRLDQLLRIGWRWLMPLAVINILATVAIIYWLGPIRLV